MLVIFRSMDNNTMMKYNKKEGEGIKEHHTGGNKIPDNSLSIGQLSKNEKIAEQRTKFISCQELPFAKSRIF